MAERAAHELHPRTGLEKFAPAVGAPARVRVTEELYVVASTSTLEVQGGTQTPMSKGAAYDKLRELVKGAPADQWQVLSVHEAKAA